VSVGVDVGGDLDPITETTLRGKPSAIYGRSEILDDDS
jgi:hypothetical protein